MKRKYKIEFNKTTIDKKYIYLLGGYEWKEISSNQLISLITSYCEKYNIEIKKLIIEKVYDWKNCILVVKCIKKDYYKLIEELNKKEYLIEIVNFGTE